jgi:hypothetical protein
MNGVHTKVDSVRVSNFTYFLSVVALIDSRIFSPYAVVDSLVSPFDKSPYS